MNPHLNKVIVSACLFLGMFAIMTAEWLRGVESKYGAFYGIVAGILLINAIAWWEEGERRRK